MRVAFGGTFDPLHDGHKKLLECVYELSEGNEIVIGVTSDAMARAWRDRDVRPFEERAAAIQRYMREAYDVDVRVVKLHDRYGPTLNEDFDFIVISPETYPVAVRINELRKTRGKKPIRIVRVEHVKAADGGLISSTRIKSGEIDTHGTPLHG